MKIGIIKEGKIPIDRRVPITPSQAAELNSKYDTLEVVCQSSDIRCFSDVEYRDAGVKVVNDVRDCDVLLGVKEVPLDLLIEGKTYFFFSHTIKEQPYNAKLLKTILEKNITLIDYEVLTEPTGNRIVAFGRYAGIVGAYNAIWTFGERYNLFHIRRAHECFDLDDLKTEFGKVKLPPIKIALTGGGRVAKGAMEVLVAMGIRKVTPASYLTQYFDEPVFTQLNSRDYNKTKDASEFKRSEFYKNPDRFESDFHKYAEQTDVLIAGAFWDPRGPVLFTPHQAADADFKIRIIADITCDIEGSIPSTKKPSTIDDPVYDYDPTEDRIEQAFRDEGNITVMAIDNLPCELPRNASQDFGTELVNHVIPNLIGKDKDQIIERATIAKNGELTPLFSYLEEYARNK